MQKEAAGSVSGGVCYTLSAGFQPLRHLISSPEEAQDCAFWGQHRAPSRLVGASKAFQIGSTRVAQHGATSAIQDTLCWDLTFVQFEDGVSHGRQHPLSFQDVDIPEPQGEGERGLFQTHKQKTSLLALHY